MGRRLLPSLTALQVFDAAARHASFTRAAVELCVTQSAVSRQIKQLESFIGQPLFLRSSGGLVLTSTGVDYAATVRNVLDQAEDATLQLISHGGRADALTLAVLPTFGSRWMVPRLADFIGTHPSIQLNIKTYIEPFDFAGSDVDLALHFGADAWPGAVCHRLMGEVAVPVCAPSLLGGRLALDDPRDVGKHPLLQHATRPTAWIDWFGTLGVAGNEGLKGPRFDQFYMVIQAAVAGLGVALLPQFLVTDELETGRLVIAARHMLETELAYWLVYPKEKAHLPVVTLFRDWLLDLVSAAPDLATASTEAELKATESTCAGCSTPPR